MIDSFDLNKLNKLTEKYAVALNSDKRLGFCLRVSRRGENLIERCCGPINSSSILPVSSLTKHFTAISAYSKDILQKKLHHYFNCPPRFRELSVSELISHTSGIPEFLYLPTDAQINSWNLSQAIDFIFSLTRKQTGSFLYSNSNYVLLSRVLEIEFGDRYDRCIRESAFGPLKLLNTYSYDELLEKESYLEPLFLKDTSAWSLADTNRGRRGWGDSSFYSSIEDLERWATSSQFTNHISKLISSGQGQWYNGGLFLNYKKPLAFHTGSTIGAESFLAYFPAEMVTAIYLSNHNSTASQDLIPALVEIIDAV